jgi:hypothetical protein
VLLAGSLQTLAAADMSQHIMHRMTQHTTPQGMQTVTQVKVQDGQPVNTPSTIQHPDTL